MQRVLSFQMARGLNETSEFVTKRMCFSLIFSVGFLSLLCGFLLGRFVTQRAVEFRAEKERLELAGNGLENTEYLQHVLLEQLERAPFDPDFYMKGEFLKLKKNDIYKVNNILSNLSFIQKVDEHESYLIATTKGSREPDRYVMLATSNEGVGIVITLMKVLNQIQEEYKWKPRRSFIFCLFSGESCPCQETLSNIMRHRVVTYIVVQPQAIKVNSPFVVSGSDIVQSVVMDSTSTVKNWFSYNDQVLSLNDMYYNVSLPRLALDIPHAVLSFMSNSAAYNESHQDKKLHKIILAQVLSETIWRLSESLVIRWNPTYFNETIIKTLEFINSNELLDLKEKLQDTLIKLLYNIKQLNEKIDESDNTNALNTRILNDFLMNLDRILLCPDKEQQSLTDWTMYYRLHKRSLDTISMYMVQVVKCYEDAIEFLKKQ